MSLIQEIEDKIEKSVEKRQGYISTDELHFLELIRIIKEKNKYINELKREIEKLQDKGKNK